MDDSKSNSPAISGLESTGYAATQTRNTIERLTRTGWLEPTDPAADADPAQLLATLKSAVLTTTGELLRIIGHSREALKDEESQCKLHRAAQLLASEIALLETGNEAKVLHSIGRRDMTNALHYRQLNKAVASSHRILTEPVCVQDPAIFGARKEGEKPEFRSRMTKKKATDFILRVFADVGVERSEEWVRDEIKRYNRRFENMNATRKTPSKPQKFRNQYIGAPSIIAHRHNCLSWKERADFNLVQDVIRTSLTDEIQWFLEVQETYER